MNASPVSPLQDGAAHILAAALDRDPADRLTFLVEACGEEYALLAEVRGLLAAHESMPGQFLDEPAADDPELTAQLAADDVPALDATDATAPMQPPKRPVTSRPSASAYAAELPLPEDLQAWMPQGEYIIESFLGQGGMGAVYKGLQMPLRRPVAIKILTKRQAGEEDDFAFEERFKREAYAMASLTHPHIVQVYDCGDAGENHLFISMELVEGGDLSDAIKGGRLTTEAALKFILQICAGMQVAHERGVVHRDIKPANIFLTKDGRAKVADFGLAKKFNAHSTFVTKVGMGMGTPDYAAPEQYDGIPDLDHRADLYALGVMMYQMLTGRLPRGSTFKTPSQLVGVDARIDDVVAKAMASERDERYQSAAELAADLAAIMAAPPRTVVTRTSPTPAKTGPAPRTTSPVSRPPTPTPAARTGATPVPRRPATQPKPMQKPKSGVAGGIIAFVVTLAVIAGGAWLMQKPKQKPTTPSAPSTTAWRPLFTEAEWKKTEPGMREFVDGRLHMQTPAPTTPPSPATKPPSGLTKPQSAADSAIRARIVWQEGSGNVGVSARMAPDGERYKLNLTLSAVKLLYITGGGGSYVLVAQELSKPRKPGDTVLIELRTQGDHLTALVDGAVVADIRDSHLPGPGEWGINATDGWFESVEVQTLPPATAPQAAPVENTFGPWQPLLTDAEWNAKATNREVVNGRLHLMVRNEQKRQPAADGAIRARIQLGEASRDAALVARQMPDGSKYKLQVRRDDIVLYYFPPASPSTKTESLRNHALPAGVQSGDTLLVELRLQGDRLTALVNDAVVIEVQDSRATGPGLWGLNATDGWFESAEVQTPPVPASSRAWQPLFTDAEWKQTEPGKREVVDGRVHLQEGQTMLKPQPAADGAIRTRIQFRKGLFNAGLNARVSESGWYKLELWGASTLALSFVPSATTTRSDVRVIGKYSRPKPLEPGDTVLIELRLQGDRLTALIDGAVVIEAGDSRAPGPGEWGIIAHDGWFESVEVQTPPPAVAAITSSTLSAPAADGWEDLLAPLTPELVAQTGHGWSMKDGELFSPNTQWAALPLPGNLSGASYQVRVKIRQIAAKEIFSLSLPIGDRVVSATLDGWPGSGHYSGFSRVNGKDPQSVPGSLHGKQVKDSEPHELEVTVRLDGANATLTTTLDSRPLYEWIGPTSALSLHSGWHGDIKPGTLTLGTMAGDWVVSEVKVKRLDK